MTVMKKILMLITLLLFVAYYGALAQRKTNVRQGIQQVRIAQGVKSGELTKAERRALKLEQRHIRRTKRRAAADGVITPHERNVIDRKQRRASRHIRRQKNDLDTRPNG